MRFFWRYVFIFEWLFLYIRLCTICPPLAIACELCVKMQLDDGLNLV